LDLIRSAALRRGGRILAVWFAGWSLQRRLLAAIIALLAGVCLLIGVASTVAMQQFTLRQVDNQLRAAAARVPGPSGGGPGGGGGISDPSQCRFPTGQIAGTVNAETINGQLTRACVLQPGYEPNGLKPLTTEQSTALLTVPTNRPVTRSLADLGDYRLVARQTFDGDIEITGLPMEGAQETVELLVLTELIVVIVGLVLAGFIGAAIVRLSLRPLSRVAATAGRVAELPLAQGEVDLSVRVPDADTDSRTEVGRVGAALNRMLGHVGDALAVRHGSEMRVRQFVADASHELRTPLAAIRGYAELTRRGREEVPPDIAHALGRIESESARMTNLVDDLLLLARLDIARGLADKFGDAGRPLDRDLVDLSRLLVDTVNDAHAAGPDHRWLLDLPDKPVTVPGDNARLHQVLANLLANARAHTRAATTVTASLATVDSWAEVTVTDDGPGIPDELQPDIFERFARGDTSRSRAAGSTGLGLAIVAAVVEAHQGTVTVTSRPGQTRFVVRLPSASAEGV
jgi:two-component system OmpR family sensor kinase